MNDKLARKQGVACVLLSGGMDSTACLHWTLDKYAEVRALGFDYGQPHRNAELTVAGMIAERNKVAFETVVLADTLHSGLLAAVPVHDYQQLQGFRRGVGLPVDTIDRRVHQAFVPGRNLVFLSVALSRACRWWPEGGFSLVIGACLEDAAGFPDCTLDFLAAANSALSAAVNRQVSVLAPYSRTSKRDLVKSVMLAYPQGLDDLRASWSCYAGKGPCGICTPCVLRAEAFAEHGLEDGCTEPELTGGDVNRGWRFG